MTEAEYRKKIQETYSQIEPAFDAVDPDLAECDQSLGSMTITFGDRSRCILSSQPSVRQLWLAVASKGEAFHFNWDEAQREWRDDKGKGIELLSYLEKFFSEKTGLHFQFKRPEKS